MVREIKTTLALDGEKKFKEALSEAGREMRVMNSELKMMAAEFKGADDQQTYFAKRSEVMNKKVKQQEEIVSSLERALHEMGNSTKYSARQVDDYTIRLNNAKEKLFNMRREAEDAARELEELGRDSDKIGRQIENGIGDAAEEVSESLDGMFAKVASDVNALKGNVAFQTTMNVGEFVMDGIQSAMQFVQENQEFNRRIAQTRSVVEMYGYNADEILQIAKHAASITGDFENAQEALVNLAAAGFENEEQIEATVQNLLGIWLSSGGTLDFSGLAEDYLESVKDKTPTGAYAEAIIKFTDRSVEDVQKVLESMKTNSDTLEAATAVLTEAGMQTVAEEYKRKNAEIIASEEAAINLSISTAKLADELTPVVTSLLNGTTTLVDTITLVVQKLKGIEWPEDLQLPENMTVGEGWNTIKAAKENGVTTLDMLNAVQLSVETEKVGPEKWAEKYSEWRNRIIDAVLDFNRNMDEKILNWFLPDSSAEELESQWAIEGEKGAQAYYNAFGAAFENSEHADVYRSAFEQLGVDTSTTEAEETGADVGQAVVDGMSSAEDNAYIVGQNISTALGNGIAAAAPGALQNAMDLVSQMNDVLGMVAVPWYMTPTQFQLSTPQGGGGSVPVGIDIDGQRVGEVLYDSISRAGGRAVMNTMLVK